MPVGRWGVALTGLCFAAASHAAMTLGQTRVIVTDAERRVMVQVKNADRVPVLLQAWVDARGEAEHPPESSHIPFVLDPPVMRLEPGQTRAIQVMFTQPVPHLPTDRESLYWFSVLEIPALPDGDADSRLDVSVLSRLKLFYRPEVIAALRYRVNQKSDVAPLRFSLQSQELLIDNPAPIHQTLATLAINDTALAPLMVAPLATVRVPVPAPLSHRATLRYATIDDDGNLAEQTTVLTMP